MDAAMKRNTIVVRAQWDPEAEVWVATSDDLPGLVTEADNQQELVKKLHDMIPDLLEGEEFGGEEFGGGDLAEIPVMIMSEQPEKVRLRA